MIAQAAHNLAKPKHVHDYKIIGERVPKRNDAYTGTTGDTAILYYVCDCKERIAFDTGPYVAMKAKLKDLQERQKQWQHENSSKQ